MPLSVVILLALFVLQRFGTGAVGWLFGPVILLFFAVIGILGLKEIVQHPGVLQGLSPSWAVRFMIDHGVYAWLTLGGVVLCCTGAEALYADRGHFGATPIRMTWFTIVLPAVMLSYLGQGAFILSDPKNVSSPNFNPFFQLVPHGLLVPMVVLATAATIIASQAAITGSFSVAKQAVQLGFLPRLRIVHTSNLEGQIYVPIINWILCAGVATLVLVFRSSNKLGDIYGVAVTGTFILNTILFLAVARALWHTPKWRLAALGTLFLTVEVAFFTSNLSKIGHGAYLPLGVGLVVATVMITWRRGREIVTKKRTEQEGPLPEFLEEIHRADPPIARIPGTAVFLNPGQATTPLALRRLAEHTHMLHEKVVIVSVDTVAIPVIDPADRFAVCTMGHGSTQGHARDDALRLPQPPGRARRVAPGAQGGPPGAQPRPGARVIFPVAHHDHAQRARRDAPLAQEAVRDDGPQRRQPDRALRTPRRTDRDHGLAGRRLKAGLPMWAWPRP